MRGVTELPLQVDVNEWWSLDEALDALPQLAELGVQYCEQPLRPATTGGATLKERSPIPIYVDEDCHRSTDVAALRRDRARRSTSSSRSRAASARRCGWRTRPARSGSA